MKNDVTKNQNETMTEAVKRTLPWNNAAAYFSGAAKLRTEEHVTSEAEILLRSRFKQWFADVQAGEATETLDEYLLKKCS